MRPSGGWRRLLLGHQRRRTARLRNNERQHGAAVPAGSGLKFSAISVGSSFTCGFCSLLDAVCWETTHSSDRQPLTTRSLSVQHRWVRTSLSYRSALAPTTSAPSTQRRHIMLGQCCDVGNRRRASNSRRSRLEPEQLRDRHDGCAALLGRDFAGIAPAGGHSEQSPALVTQVVTAVSVSVGTNAAGGLLRADSFLLG